MFYNKTTFQYVFEIVDKLLAENADFKENMSNIHLILLNDVDSSGKIDLSEISETRQDAQQLCEKLHCIFLDANDYYSAISPQHQHKFIDNMLNSIIEIMPFEDLKYKDSYATEMPDIRIIMCMFCGDPYSIENVMQSMTNETACVSNGDRNITFELFLGDQKRRVEVILSSYHGANAFRDELVHGFILLYSTKRKASLSTLNAFSMNIPNLPMQIAAITEPGGVSAFFNNEICQILITEGNSIADKLRAHFVTAGDEENQFKCEFLPLFYHFFYYNVIFQIPSRFFCAIPEGSVGQEAGDRTRLPHGRAADHRFWGRYNGAFNASPSSRCSSSSAPL